MTDIESVREYTAAVIFRSQITQPIWTLRAVINDAIKTGCITPEEREHLDAALTHLLAYSSMIERRCGEIGCKAFDLDPSLVED